MKVFIISYFLCGNYSLNTSLQYDTILFDIIINDEYSGERLVLNLRNLPREITRNNMIVKTEQDNENSKKER